jgi:hypothetical protein
MFVSNPPVCVASRWSSQLAVTFLPSERLDSILDFSHLVAVLLGIDVAIHQPHPVVRSEFVLVSIEKIPV